MLEPDSLSARSTRIPLRKDWFRWILLVPLSCVVLSGCGGRSDGPNLYRVTGEVTFDGQPVEEGRIIFRKSDGDQKAYSGEILNGKYDLEAEEGQMIVEITATRIIPGQFGESGGDEPPPPAREMFIPATYNTETTLTAEVAPSRNEIPFVLEAQ